MSNVLLIVDGVSLGDTWALVGICFSIVLIIMAFFVGIMAIFGVVAKGKSKKAETSAVVAEPKAKTENKIDDADYAAIATALHLYFGGEHDIESNVLTIKNVSQNYSPWLNN